MASYSWPATGSGGGGGSVTSVGLVAPVSVFTITGSPVTTSGDLVLTFNNQSANTVFAGPTTGAAAVPAFRALVSADIPSLSYVSSVSASAPLASSGGLTPNITISSGNLTDVGTDGITITGGTGAVIGSGTSISQHVADTTHNGYLSSTDWNTFNGKQSALTFGNLTDAGTDGITITSGTGAVIGSGTSISQHVADTTHNGYLSSTDWNTFNGKGTGSVTSVTFTGDGTVLSATPSSPVTTTGTLTAALNSQNANTFLAGPTSGGAAAPTFRNFATSDFVFPTVQIALGGSGTYTPPSSPRAPLYLKVTIVGGGGGGGAGGTSASNGGDGGTTTFGSSLLTCVGGAGGIAGSGSGGVGGTATTSAPAVSILNLDGGAGAGLQFVGGTNTVQTGGNGGTNLLGGGGTTTANASGFSGVTNSGGGGGGGAGNVVGAVPGAGGGAGAYIQAFVPVGTYSYSVGAGGTAGTSSANGFNGGSGAAGQVIVEEYYQ